MVGMPDFREVQWEKKGQNWKNCPFQGNQGQLFQFWTGRLEVLFYTFLTQITLSFI